MQSTLRQWWRREMATWNPRLSMSFNNAKGLLNAPGENNCFLNSAVQVLWHLDVFRRSFRLLSGHVCMSNSCIFCALKVIFTQFQYSDQSSLPPDALRKALAKCFADQQRFQLGHMDDAAECFENILMRIHFHIANQESEDMCNARHCISHQKFAMTVVEQVVCKCGATSEPLPFSQMVYYVSASALVAQAKDCQDRGPEPAARDLFAQLLRTAASQGDYRDCPSNCGERVQIRRSLMNLPDVVSIGLIWDSDHPTQDHIKDVVQSIGTSLRLPDLFHSVVDDRWANSSRLQLVGVVCYYGKHYSTFFFHSKMKRWIYFDDATVRELGTSWTSVTDKCCRGHYQPLLLLYSSPNGTPVSVETAPQSTTFLPGQDHRDSVDGGEPGGSGRSRAGPDRRPQYSRGGYSHSSFPSQEPSQRGESQPRDYYQYSTAPRLEIKPTPQHYVSRSPLPSQYQHHPRQDQTWGYQGHKRPEQQQGHQYHNGQVHLQSHQRYDSRDQPMALPSHGRQASYLLAVEQPKQSTADRVSAGPGHTGVASQSQPGHSGVPSQGQPGHIGVPSQGQPGHSGVPSQIQPGQSAVPSQSQPGHSGVPSQRPLSQPLSNRMAPSGHYVNGMDQVGYSMKPEASDLEQGECALEWQAGMMIGYPQMHPPSPQHGAGNSAHGQVNGYPQHEVPNVYSSTVSRVSTSHSDAIKQNLSSSSPLRQRVNRAHLEALSTITQPLQADLLMHTPVPDSSGNLLIPEKGFASETARTLPSVSVEANHNGIDRDTQSDNEKYDWTLSNSDQYKRRQVPPVGDSGETLNIVAGHQSTRLAKVNEIQRIESFKKGNLGKGRIGADVVRYQFDTGVPPPSPGATNGRAPDSASDVSRTDQSEVEAVNCTGTSPPIDILNAVNHVRENSLTSSGKSFDDINLDPDGSPLHERHSTLSRNRPHSARPFDYGHVKPVVLSRTSNSSPMPPGDSGTARLCSAYPSPDTAQEHRHSRPSSAKQTNVGAYPQWQAGDRQSASANYINRKAVESVLQYQQLRTPQTTGQQRAAQATNTQTGIHSSGQKRAPQASGQQKLQGSGHSVLVGGSSGHRLRAGSNSHSSSSSLDSLPYTDSSHKHLKVVQAAQVKEALKVDIPDTASITSHRDSGYRSGSSGDRNSASSTSSTSMESPSVDGHLNYSQRQHMKSLLGYGYDKSNSSSDSLSSTSGHSSQSYSTVRSGQKLGRIPENGHPSSQYMDGSSSGSSTLSNGSTLQQPSKPLPSQPKRPAPVLNKDATLNFKPGQVPPQCETLCMKAEDLVDQSMVKEKQGDLPLALCLCTQAVTYLQKALNVPNTSTETYIYARMKHNTCVLRSRSLHRRIMMRQESTQSKESSTSDASLEDSSSSSVKDMRVEPKGSEDLILLEVPEQPHEKLKEQIKELYQQPSATGHAGIQESGQNQRASGQTLGSSGQTQGLSGPTEGSVEQHKDMWMVRSVTDSVLVQHTKPSIRSMKDSSVQSKPNVRTVRDIKQRSAQSKLAAKGEASDSRFMELYGTLPRKAGRKVQRSPSLHSTTGVQDHQFKDAHKGAAVVPASNLARTTARSEICLHNPSLDSRPTTPTPGKMNKEHIRQLLVNDMLVRKSKQPIQPNRMEENLLSGRKSPGLNSIHNQNDGHTQINQLLQQDISRHQQTLHNPDPKQQPHRQHFAPPGGVGTYHATQLSNDSQHSSSYHPGGRHSRHNSSSTLVPSEHSRQNSSSSQQSFGHYSRYDRTEPTHAHHTHNSNSSRERIEYRRPNNSLSTDGREYNRQNSHQSAYSGSGQDRGHDEAGSQGVVPPGGGVGEVEGELSRLSLQQHLDRLQAQQMQMFSNQQQWKAQNQNGLDALSPGVSRPDPSQYAPGGTYMKKSISYGQLTAQPTGGLSGQYYTLGRHRAK